MDGIVLVFFLLAAFAGGFASNVSGFAMGFIVSGAWHHILTPLQTTALIVGYGLLTEGYGFKQQGLELRPLACVSLAAEPIGVFLDVLLDDEPVHGASHGRSDLTAFNLRAAVAKSIVISAASQTALYKRFFLRHRSPP
jgi:hypothetical protein